MNKFYLTVLLSIFSAASYATDITLPIKYVYDGDTIISELVQLPSPLNKVSIRLLGIDTPELRNYKCPEEKDLATKAKNRLVELMGTSKQMLVKDVKWDKYGGRILGTVFTMEGIDVNKVLITEGLAKSYNGGQKSSWCSK